MVILENLFAKMSYPRKFCTSKIYGITILIQYVITKHDYSLCMCMYTHMRRNVCNCTFHTIFQQAACPILGDTILECLLSIGIPKYGSHRHGSCFMFVCEFLRIYNTYVFSLYSALASVPALSCREGCVPYDRTFGALTCAGWACSIRSRLQRSHMWAGHVA